MACVGSQGEPRCKKVIEEGRKEFDKRRHENGGLMDGKIMNSLHR